MGGGVAKDKVDQKRIVQKNTIFLEEGVGIEQSNLSRRWTHKLSVFKNIDADLIQEQIPEDDESPQNKRQKSSEESESILYDSESQAMHSIEDDREIRLNQGVFVSNNKTLFGQNKTQFEFVKENNNPIFLEDVDKKFQIFYNLYQKDDSDIDQLSEEDSEQRIHANQFQHNNNINLSDNDSKDDEKDEQLKKMRMKFDKVLEDFDCKSVDSQQDLEFIEQIDQERNEIFQSQKQVFQMKDFSLKRLYLRSRLGTEKLVQGQEKKVKFDAKQDEHFDLYEVSENHPKSIVVQHEKQKQKDYQPQDFLSEIGIAIASRKGNKKDGPHMNDYFVYTDHYCKAIALLNSHGEFGHFVSNIAYRLLFKTLFKLPLFYTNPKKALQRVLYQLQNQVRNYFEGHRNDNQNCILSGTVITILIQMEGRILIGHLGDNRVTVYKELQHVGKQKKIVVELTPIHCPLDFQEKARIFTSGGEVRKTQMEEYVYVRGRLYPQLHVTRTIGDLIGHVIGVTSIPYIKEYDITFNDTFLIMSTSPTFMYMEQEEIMNHLTGFTLKTIRQACDSLYKRAKSSWIVSDGVFEDMTIILLWLGPYKEQK